MEAFAILFMINLFYSSEQVILELNRYGSTPLFKDYYYYLDTSIYKKYDNIKFALVKKLFLV